jgi:copper chaperone CopZ
MRFEVLIDGMLAVHAKHAVFMALTAVEGITHADVDLGRAEITHDGRATESSIRAAIESAGFTVRTLRVLPRTLPML